MISGETCVVIGGFGGPGMGFRLGGTGDITKSSRLWRNEKNPQSIGTGVFLGKHVYRANAARPAVQCINPQTGEVIWGAPNRMGSAWGSIVAAADRLYLTNQQGMTMVFKADPEKFELLSTNDLKEPSNATPAIAHGRIFIRT